MAYEDLVWSRDDSTGQQGWREIEARTSSYHDAVVVLVIRDADGDEQVIRTTEGHPFFVAAEPGIHLARTDAAGRWVAAGDLAPGDRLSNADGAFAEVVSARSEAEPRFKAYNLTVEGFHNYFVAETLDDQAVWVHNCGGGPPSLVEQAAALVGLNNGKARVTMRSPSQQLEIDLTGKSHAGIPTPHTKTSLRNQRAPGQVYNTSNKKSTTTPSTQQEIRAVRKFLNRR